MDCGGCVCHDSHCCSVWMVVVPCSVVWYVCIHNGLIVACQFNTIYPCTCLLLDFFQFVETADLLLVLKRGCLYLTISYFKS